MNNRFFPGDACPQGGYYGQFRDHDEKYAGNLHDRFVTQGQAFPPALHGHHYRYGGVHTGYPAVPAAARLTAWDPDNPVTAG